MGKNIDIWAKINNEYLIIIEDKTFTENILINLKRIKRLLLNGAKKIITN